MLFGYLYEHPTGTPLRPATVTERGRSRDAETDANPLGVFEGRDGVRVYVGDAPGDE